MQKIFIYPFIILMLLLALQSSVLAVAKQVTVSGFGADEQAALDDAFRNAVEQAVGVLVDAQTLVKNYQVLNDEIYTHSQGFIQDYTILKQEKWQNQVKITAQINVDTEPNSALLAELQRFKLIKKIQNPRLAVLITEYHINRQVPDPAGETAVIKKLKEAGFKRIIDPNQLERIRNKNVAQLLFAGDKKTAHSLATKYGLDYLIVGEAFSEYVGNVLQSGIHSCRARIEAKLIKADTGQIIATNGFHVSGVDITEILAGKVALTEAGAAMGDYMVEQLLAYAGDSQQEITLTITGLSNYGKVTVAMERLQKIRGIKNIYLREYAGGLASLDVDYSGSIQVLAKEIQALPGMEIKTMTGSSLTIIMY